MTEIYLKRIDDLLHFRTDFEEEEGRGWRACDQVYKGTLGLTTTLYGENTTQAKTLRDAYAAVLKADRWDTRRKFFEGLKGTLENMKAEIEHGLIRDLKKEASGEVLGDFVGLAKTALGDGHREVAVVLAAAALEDGLKHVATANGLDPSGKEVSDVIGLLKANGMLSGAEGPVAQGFVRFRNKALHADWEGLDAPSINGALAFLESFLIKYLS